MPTVVTARTRSRTSARDGRNLTLSYVTKNRPRRGVRPKFLKFFWRTHARWFAGMGSTGRRAVVGFRMTCKAMLFNTMPSCGSRRLLADADGADVGIGVNISQAGAELLKQTFSFLCVACCRGCPHGVVC